MAKKKSNLTFTDIVLVIIIAIIICIIQAVVTTIKWVHNTFILITLPLIFLLWLVTALIKFLTVRRKGKLALYKKVAYREQSNNEMYNSLIHRRQSLVQQAINNDMPTNIDGSFSARSNAGKELRRSLDEYDSKISSCLSELAMDRSQIDRFTRFMALESQFRFALLISMTIETPLYLWTYNSSGIKYFDWIISFPNYLLILLILISMVYGYFHGKSVSIRLLYSDNSSPGINIDSHNITPKEAVFQQTQSANIDRDEDCTAPSTETLEERRPAMGDTEWTLLHDLAYLYYATVIIASAQEQCDNTSDVENRFSTIRTKLSEWGSGNVEHDKILQDVGQLVQDDLGESGEIKKMADRFWIVAEELKKHLPQESHDAVIDDLVYIINSPTPTTAEIDIVRKIATYLNVNLPDKVEHVSITELESTSNDADDLMSVFSYSTKNADMYLAGPADQPNSQDAQPPYPGEFYFDTKKYHLVPLQLKRFPRLSKINHLFRKMYSIEVDAICNKIIATRTIPILSFVDNMLSEHFSMHLGKTSFGFLPFVILADKIGCFVVMNESGIWGNCSDELQIDRIMDADLIKSINYIPGFDDGEHDDHISRNGVSTVRVDVSYDNGYLTLNEFHGEGFGSQLRILVSIWTLWSEVVEYGRNKNPELYELSFHGYDSDYAGAPSFKEFRSWEELVQWAFGRDESTVIRDSGAATLPQQEDELHRVDFQEKGQIKRENEQQRNALSKQPAEDEREGLFKQMIEIALSDGEISLSEREKLDSVRRQLGISEKRAIELEGAMLAHLKSLNLPWRAVNSSGCSEEIHEEESEDETDVRGVYSQAVTQEEGHGRPTSRDKTKYYFLGNKYTKGRLVLAVIQYYLKAHPDTTFSQLKAVFPDHLQKHKYGVFAPLEVAEDIRNRTGHKRYFMDEVDILTTADGKKIVVTSQWGISNMDLILITMKKLGYDIRAE